MHVRASARYNYAKVLKFKLNQRVLLYFIAIAILPLVAINLYWLSSEQRNLRQDAVARQELLTANSANFVNQYINSKVNTVIIHSQTASVQQFDIKYASQELIAFINQDSDLDRISLVDATGMERVAYDRKGGSPLGSAAGSDAFKVVTFLAGKEYISPVTFDANKDPHITLAAPLVTLDSGQSLGSLSTAVSGKIRSSSDIKGALIVDVNLKNLWQTVLSSKLGINGYAYVVDDKGFLIAYPSKSFIVNHRQLNNVAVVSKYLTNPYRDKSVPSETTSETGQKVLSSYQVIPRTNWAVIAEEPTSSILTAANRVASNASIIFLLVFVVVVPLGIFFSREITAPIRELTDGAKRFGEGDLSYQIKLSRSDELGFLAKTFNSMTANLTSLITGLEIERNKLDVVLNSVTEGLVAVGDNETIVLANSAAAGMAHKNLEDLKGHRFSELFLWTRDHKPVSIDYGQTSSVYYKDVTWEVDTETKLYADLLVVPIEDDRNGIKAIIAIRDQTKNHDLEAMKLDFVSMAAHELRTPLTAIRGYVGLIAEDTTSQLSPQTKGYISRTATSARQLVGLINNLLSVSHIERDAVSLTMIQLDLASLLNSVAEDQHFAALEKNLELTYTGPSKGVMVMADDLSLREVVNNLVSNAIHYTQTGTIKISLTESNGSATVDISDKGIGIPAQSIPHLFTKFYRVHGGLASGSGGTGLGLYIAHSIIERHNGKIWVKSTAGKGSTFSFSLPTLTEEQKQSSSGTPGKIRKEHGWTTKNIDR